MNEERHSGDYPGSFAENTIEANSYMILTSSSVKGE